MARYETAQQCLVQAGIEVGLNITGDPYASTDPAVIQMRGILNSAGRELTKMREWQRMVVTYSFTTVFGDTGFYTLPADYDRHIDQTDWNPTNRLPLGGPLSAQDYTYLLNTNLASSTIYISFREKDGQFVVLPQPPPPGQVINFEYISRYWVCVAAAPTILAKDAPTQSDDVLMYDPIIIQKLVKLRWLEAKRFDTSAASEQFNNALGAQSGQDKSAPVLYASRSRSFPYLDDRNVPETGYGLP